MPPRNMASQLTTPKKPAAAEKNNLQDRLRGIAAGSASSLHPEERPVEEEPIPSVTDIGLPLPTRRGLEALIQQDTEWAAQEKQAKKEREAVRTAIKKILADHAVEAPSFQCGAARVTRFTSFRSSLNKMKLLKHGVKQAVLDACTDKTPVENLKITVLGDEE